MTFAELANDCWRDLPTVRKWIAGREVADKLLADAVREFEPDRADRVGYDERLMAKVRRRNETKDGEGFVILTFILATIAGAVISWLIQRWLDHRFPPEQLQAWREELAT